MTHETNRNNEDAPTREAACAPGGNYGLCKTHLTCEMIQGRLKAQDAELAALKKKLNAALALADTGSDEHRKRFEGAWITGTPGWRVVEAMRETLIGG